MTRLLIILCCVLGFLYDQGYKCSWCGQWKFDWEQHGHLICTCGQIDAHNCDETNYMFTPIKPCRLTPKKEDE